MSKEKKPTILHIYCCALHPFERDITWEVFGLLKSDFDIIIEKKLHILGHSSEIRGLCSTKCSSETIKNLLHFMYKKIHVVFFVFHFMQL